jgi:hypothetical protein
MAAPRGRSRLCAALLAAAVPACAIGPAEDPGCHKDPDCDLGFVCRAGACFRVTTTESPPNDPADAGAGGLAD